MGGIVDDIVNPIGAITGIDPVKDATGFTGTDMGMTKAQKAAAAQQQAGGAPAVSGGGGGQRSNGDALDAISAQNYGAQQKALMQQLPAPNQPQSTPVQQAPMGSSFGNQLAALHQQVTAPPVALPAVASPSATQLAADVTAQTVNSKIQDPMRKAQGAQNMWGFPSMYAPR
jgi:hypothetical protein